MLYEEMQAKLYAKMTAEQEKYRDQLLRLPPNKLLAKAQEYAIREDLVMIAKEDDLPVEQIGPLLRSRTPLADVYRQWQNHQVGYLEGLRDAFERCANIISHDR